MNTGKLALNFNEKVMFALRSLYLERGYSQYKMSKFEEYDLYARNKDFLISDSVITFTDTNGRLMALKPDVTLSIIKNFKDLPCGVQKVYYNENVYRISKGSHAFKEIMQVGLECLGQIDDYQLCEVIELAAKSLAAISDRCVLDISHVGLISSVIESCGVPKWAQADILRCISEKNAHELAKVCGDLQLTAQSTELLRLLATTSGRPDEVLPALQGVLKDTIDLAPLTQLTRVLAALDEDVKSMLRIDLSVAEDIKYYTGIVFKGFIAGVPSAVLSGGQYDRLMQKMQRRSGAIGFAVYLDTLERLDETVPDYDVDTVLLYEAGHAPARVRRCVRELGEHSVFACTAVPENIKYRQLIRLCDWEVTAL